MNPTLFSNLLSDLWDDLHEPSVLWQIGTIAVCFLLAWGLARIVRTLYAKQGKQARAVHLGAESFFRVLSPLFALAFIAIAKLLLARWHHVNLLRLALPLLASFALIRLVFHILRRIFVRQGRAGSFLLLFEKVFALLVWTGVAMYITGLWPDVLQYLEETQIPVGRNKIALLGIFQAAASVVVTMILALWIGASLEERLMQVQGMHSSLRVVMARAGRALLILIAVLVSLSLVGIDLTVLSVFGGALGVGLGFGLQKIASSYVSGFVILLERSLSIDDMIAVDKYYGKVTQINTRYTVLRGLDGIESVIPNEMLISGPIQNYSLSSRELWLTTDVIVAYRTDVESLLGLLESVTAGVERVSRENPPVAYLMKFGTDGLELRVGFWINDPENGKTSVLSRVNRAIWQAFQDHGIEVPYSQRVVTLIDQREKFPVVPE